MVFCPSCDPRLNACLLAREEEMMEAGVRRGDMTVCFPFAMTPLIVTAQVSRQGCPTGLSPGVQPLRPWERQLANAAFSGGAKMCACVAYMLT